MDNTISYFQPPIKKPPAFASAIVRSDHLEEMLPDDMVQIEITKTERKPIPTFGELLNLREELQFEFNGERIDLKFKFDISEDLLLRRGILPVYRPAHATNEMAMAWKKIATGQIPFQEECVMSREGSLGYDVPQLFIMQFSLSPDSQSLGKGAKTAKELQETRLQVSDLFMWSDADNLFCLATGTHLDSLGTSTLFPFDRNLSRQNYVFRAMCSKNPTCVGIYWIDDNTRDETYGIRRVISIPLRFQI